MPTDMPGDSTTTLLPPPSADEQEHSARLVRHIRNEIGNASIPFSRFMHLALFAPGLGYYSAGKTKFGAAGDYVTAPELGGVFAYCLARQCHQILGALHHGNILEVGPGSGILAASLLLELEVLHQLPEKYYLLELSADLRERQRKNIEQIAPHLVDRVRWIETLPDKNFRGIIVANEMLDAMPVTVFHTVAEGVAERGVANNGEEFIWCDRPASRALRERVQKLHLESDYISEINFQAEAWIHSISDLLHSGVVLIIDYGFAAREYYHRQRHMGTLMCHYRHQAHANPLILVGLQDISAHIDFTAIATAAIDSGLELLGFTTQAAFLMSTGLEHLLAQANPDDAQAHLALTTQIKKLTLPSEMGELFKVMALAKNCDTALNGFAQQDWRGRL